MHHPFCKVHAASACTRSQAGRGPDSRRKHLRDQSLVDLAWYASKGNEAVQVDTLPELMQADIFVRLQRRSFCYSVIMFRGGERTSVKF